MEGGDTEELDHPEVTTSIADMPNVLLLAPSLSDVHAGGCLDLFAPDDPDSARVLGVTYRRSPDDWIETWREQVGEMPADLVVVGVGADHRSATHASTAGTVGSQAEPARNIESPEDLTGLGIVLSEQLEAWADGGELLVCFDSVTVMLQYVDLQRAFRFLHVLTGRIKTVGAQAHFHLDQTAIDEQTVATLTSLYDATVSRTEDEWVVRSR